MNHAKSLGSRDEDTYEVENNTPKMRREAKNKS
jgi:hypothetical protein